MLVAGVSAALPDEASRCTHAIGRVLAGLPHAEVAVLLHGGDELRVHCGKVATLVGYGRPDLGIGVESAPAQQSAVAAALGIATAQGARSGLPAPAVVLALHLRGHFPILALEVPRTGAYPALADVGARVVAALRPWRAVVVCSGDLSAGLRADSPRPDVPGAARWDEQAVGAIDASRLEALAKLGPQEAARVHALGWAPLAVLAGVCRAARLATVVRRYCAPRGVGYVVAQGG